MQSTRHSKTLYRYNTVSGWETENTSIIAETTVSLTVNGNPWLDFACTPTNLDALAVGFLYTEGFIQDRGEISIIDVCKQGANVDVWLNKSIERPARWQRASDCTGGLTTASNTSAARVVAENTKFAPDAVLRGMEQLLRKQELYQESGGVHSSALSDGKEIRISAEDIGQHNTIDKVAGRLLLDNFPFPPLLLFTTGRVSSEMLQKSSRLGVIAVVSRTSATTMSVELAEALGITLVGYARRDHFVVYTHPARLETIPDGEQVLLPGETPPDC